MASNNKQKKSVVLQEEEQHSSKQSHLRDAILLLDVLDKLFNVLDKFPDLQHFINSLF